MSTTPTKTAPSTRFAFSAAWIIILLASLLPDILWREFIKTDAGWIFWAKIGLLAVLLAVSYFWPNLRPLRKFIIILIGIHAFEKIITWASFQPFWQAWFGGANQPFSNWMMGTQLERLAVSLLMIGLLFALGYRRKDFFLTPGNLKAPITPVRWLGFPKPDPWTRFGGQFAVYITLGILAFLLIGNLPSGAALARLLPMVPFVLLFAAMNAFNEEMTYRASLIPTLEGTLGPQTAVLIAASFFGIGHFYGVPYGIVGVLMSTFLGWFLGKAMVETRGFFWAWLIHFLQDVMIFSFLAMGSVTPGG